MKYNDSKKEEPSETTNILSRDEQWFKRLEEAGVLRDEISSIGWAFWPKDQNNQQMGFFDEDSLRRLADEIERRNKPFWDEYNKYCIEHQDELLEPVDVPDING